MSFSEKAKQVYARERCEDVAGFVLREIMEVGSTWFSMYRWWFSTLKYPRSTHRFKDVLSGAWRHWLSLGKFSKNVWIL